MAEKPANGNFASTAINHQPGHANSVGPPWRSRAATPDQPFPWSMAMATPTTPQWRPTGVACARPSRACDDSRDLRHQLAADAGAAQPLADHLGLPVRIEADLREVLLGEWEGGVLRMKAAAGDPIYHQMQAEQRWDVIGAEDWATLNRRVTAGLGRIHAAHPDATVVAVVHGGVIGHILAYATGAGGFSFHGADNGSSVASSMGRRSKCAASMKPNMCGPPCTRPAAN